MWSVVENVQRKEHTRYAPCHSVNLCCWTGKSTRIEGNWWIIIHYFGFKSPDSRFDLQMQNFEFEFDVEIPYEVWPNQLTIAINHIAMLWNEWIEFQITQKSFKCMCFSPILIFKWWKRNNPTNWFKCKSLPSLILLHLANGVHSNGKQSHSIAHSYGAFYHDLQNWWTKHTINWCINKITRCFV